eukprot:c26208_g1_i1 orf=473-1717(-)
MAETKEEDAISKTETQVTGMSTKVTESKNGAVKRIWSRIVHLGQLFFRSSNDDFEKKLKHLSKEEAAVHTRLKRRSQAWRKLARALIVYSIIVELLILGIAIITTRRSELSWHMRALRVLPVFAFPAFSALLYSACASYHRMRERNDQKTLDRLRGERQAKIDELKERTNYYLTQQLIQRYDTDPAAKAAAASVLASRLGAEAGLKFAFESFSQDTTNADLVESNKGNDVEVIDSVGIRRRTKQQRTQSGDQIGLPDVVHDQRKNETMGSPVIFEHGLQIEHHRTTASDGGFIARLAAMLVGEDPTQCYALICGKCHMHNGLARKEDFPYISYYCPHCHAFNGSHHLGGGGDAPSESGVVSYSGFGNVGEGDPRHGQGGIANGAGLAQATGSTGGGSNAAIPLPQIGETDFKID